MFTRIVEFTAKHGKTKEVAELIQNKILPILKKQAGFVDEIVLVSTAETNRILGMSFWKTPEDAELYRREQYPKVEELLRPVLETTPKVQTFDVDTFTTHKIALGKAA
jgi:heme-degrading monooxygenase HmoA